MSQQTLGILALIVLLLPAVGAILARLAGSMLGDRAVHIVGALSFGIALASAVVLYGARVDRVALGSFAIFVPASGPLIDADAFALTRRPTDVPTVLEQTAPTEVAAASPPPATMIDTSPVPVAGGELSPSPTSTEAAVPTTALPTLVPTLAATATPAPTAQPSPTATAVPTTKPTAVPAPTARPRPTSPPTAPTSAPRTEAQAYIVEPGDTLRSIAARFDVEVEDLLRFNGLTPEEGDRLQVGQKLFIPVSTTDAGHRVEPTARPRPTSPPAAPTSAPRTEAQAYIVEPGDTLRSIAARFDVEVEDLLRFNGLTPEEGDQLQVGQKLFIPPR